MINTKPLLTSSLLLVVFGCSSNAIDAKSSSKKVGIGDANPTPAVTAEPTVEATQRPVVYVTAKPGDFNRTMSAVDLKDVKIDKPVTSGLISANSFAVVLQGAKGVTMDLEGNAAAYQFPVGTIDAADTILPLSATEAWTIGKTQFTHVAINENGSRTIKLAAFEKVDKDLKEAPKLLGLLPRGFISMFQNKVLAITFKDPSIEITNLAWPSEYASEVIESAGLVNGSFWFLTKQKIIIAESVDKKYNFSEYLINLENAPASPLLMSLISSDLKKVGSDGSLVQITANAAYISKAGSSNAEPAANSEHAGATPTPTPNVTTAPSTKLATFADAQSSCGSCHSTASAMGGFKFADEAELKANAASALELVKAKSMPMGAPLSDEKYQEMVNYLSSLK